MREALPGFVGFLCRRERTLPRAIIGGAVACGSLPVVSAAWPTAFLSEDDVRHRVFLHLAIFGKSNGGMKTAPRGSIGAGNAHGKDLPGRTITYEPNRQPLSGRNLGSESEDSYLITIPNELQHLLQYPSPLSGKLVTNVLETRMAA
ncbi:hypothetical protein F4780DRAFT_777326 [Xylariomycetidae sp. FL0641]|nr:hypothetical protein F4780DRAFT_777326 [Xylariomycetidae sp. FL0641]